MAVSVAYLFIIAFIQAAYGASPSDAGQRHRIDSRGNEDLLTSIPGYDGSTKSKHYAGYISVNEHKRMFYYFVQSERSPEDDPVVLWMNGGPGCSSLDGFIYEMGPFNFKPANAAGPNAPSVTLSDNAFAWNKVANMIYLDSPVGVGLSYSTRPADYITGDWQTAKDAQLFLRAFFERHPSFQSNDFFISGESYAGIYVPNLARAVVEANDAGAQPYINIHGYLVGNGCTDEEVDGDAYPPFAAGKSLIGREQYKALHTACGGVYWNRTSGSECDQYFSQMMDGLEGLNIYDVLEYCYHGPNPQAAEANRQALLQAQREHRGKWPLAGAPSKVGSTLNYAHLGLNPPCVDARVADAWLNNPLVRQALHAEPKEEIGRWQLCSDKIMYSREVSSTIPIHRKLIEKHGLRALIYSGDHDMAVPHTGSERWTTELGYPVESAWGPWYAADHQVGGYFVEYKGLTYATVKGAGHMVPETNPRESLAMFERFISKKSLRG